MEKCNSYVRGAYAGEDAERIGGANNLLTFAISLAFVGPVMRWLDLEGGGFHRR